MKYEIPKDHNGKAVSDFKEKVDKIFNGTGQQPEPNCDCDGGLIYDQTTPCPDCNQSEELKSCPCCGNSTPRESSVNKTVYCLKCGLVAIDKKKWNTRHDAGKE